MSTAALFTIVKITPGDQEMNIYTIQYSLYIYIYDGKLFSHKNNEVLIYAIVWMNLENTGLRATSQLQKGKCCLIPLI